MSLQPENAPFEPARERPARSSRVLNITAGMALLGLVAVAAVSRVSSEMAQYETAAEGTSYLLGLLMRVLVAGVLVSVLAAALLKG